MNYELRKVQDVDVKEKKVLLRADVDVPIQNGQIKDATRLKALLPTLEFLLKNQAIVFVAGHLGRPKQQFSISNFQFSKENEEFSLKPVAEWIKSALELHYELKEIEIEGFKGWGITDNLFVFENLRFYKEEEENSPEFSKKIASVGDLYVNDAFASSHRAHASIVGVTKFLPSFAGLRLQKEVEELSKVLYKPKRPLTIIIGGAKIETKLPLVEKMHRFADYVLVGGEIAENDKILLKVQHEKLKGKKSVLLVADLTENSKDITEKSAENFLQIAEKSETVVWNGPMGLVEEEENAHGTKILAEGISKLNSYKLVGGGDTVSFLQKIGLIDKFAFVSTGGGAMLEFLAGEKLPGLTALRKD